MEHTRERIDQSLGSPETTAGTSFLKSVPRKVKPVNDGQVKVGRLDVFISRATDAPILFLSHRHRTRLIDVGVALISSKNKCLYMERAWNIRSVAPLHLSSRTNWHSIEITERIRV